MFSFKRVCVLLLIIFLFLFSNIAAADKWKPFDFKGTEKFDYMIQNFEGKELQQELHYIIELKPTEKTGEDGEVIYEVSYTRRGYITSSELNDQMFFGYWGFEMMGFFINPIYYPMISDLDIAVGEKALIYGIGTVKITGKQDVYGREGFISELYTTGEDKKLMAVFIINPDIPVPLKVTVYNDLGEINSEVTLVEYIK